MKRSIRPSLLVAALLLAPAAPGRGQSSPSSADCQRIAEKLEWAAGRLSDWPQLGYYRNANAGLAPPKAGEDRVVFLGDGITSFWKLAEDFPGKPYINRGIGGQTTPQMLLRFRSDVIDLRPRAAVLLAGSEDIASATGPTTLEAIEENFATIAELARVHRIRLVVSSLLPVRDAAGRPGQTSRHPVEKIRALNAWIKSACARGGCVYLDYFSAMADGQGLLKAELSDDGFTPNRRGYQVMAPLAARAIAEALRPPR